MLSYSMLLLAVSLHTAKASEASEATQSVRMVHRPTGCDEVVIREVIEFGNNSTRVRRRSRSLLTTLASLLSSTDSPVLLLSIEGYQAPDESEENLAYARALAVHTELLALGVHPSRLAPLGHDSPLWPAREATWSERRVEFDVLLYGACL